MNSIGEKVLVTTSNWFYAPDGKQYRAIWGTLHAIHEAGKTLGFVPNRAHANWFLEIGSLTVMGCQVMYLIRCPEKPHTGRVNDYQSSATDGLREFDRPGNIWITE